MVTPISTNVHEPHAQNGHRQEDGDLSVHKITAKLIVTFVGETRLSHREIRNNATDDDLKPGGWTPLPFTTTFRSLFSKIAPAYSHIEDIFPASDITQSIFHTYQPNLLDCPSLRHTPAITTFEKEHDLEVIFDQIPNALSSPHSQRQRPLRLAVFDMDSTLINEEVIDELARSIGKADAVSAITARAMNGELDFASSLKARVAMLEGVPVTVWEDLKKSITIAEGARTLISGLRRRGILTAVVSGGFTPMAEWLKGELGLDIAVANHLLTEPASTTYPFPHLSGQLDPDYPIVTPELKRDTLLSLAAAHSIPLSESLAVGDGSNDLLMLEVAGLGIAWNAKEKVQLRAPMRLNGRTLADLLEVLGLEE